MSRKVAREYAYQLIFEYVFLQEKSYALMDLFFVDQSLTQDDREFLKSIYDGVVDKYSDLIEKIKSLTKNFDINRIYKADLSVLLLAMYEMYYREDIPLSVSIHEAVEISKKYSTEKSNVYVNGILASVYKEIENSKKEIREKDGSKIN